MTNAVIENILTRRSVRAFQEKPIAREAIETLLQCATHAPSAMNRQTWHFSAVLNPGEDPEARRRDGQGARQPQLQPLPPGRADHSLKRDGADQDMGQRLRAGEHPSSPRTRWASRLVLDQPGTRIPCNDPGVRAVLTELGVPEDHMVYGMAALGYAAAEPKDVEKKYPVTIIE